MSEPSSRARVRALALAAICAAALGLAACGDDDDDSSTAATEATTVESATEDESTTTDEANDETTTEDAETTESEDTSGDDSDLGELLRAQPGAESMESEQIDCVAAELEANLTDEQLEAVKEQIRTGGTGSQIDQDIVDAAADAAQTCLKPSG